MNEKEEVVSNLILEYLSDERLAANLKTLTECYTIFITGCAERDILEFKLKSMRDDYERR